MKHYTKGPHITTFIVRPVTDADNAKLKSGQRAYTEWGDTGYILIKLDETTVPDGELIPITVRMDRGAPRLVYIDGSHPLYETWVKLEDGTIVAHFPGLLIEKDWEYVNHG